MIISSSPGPLGFRYFYCPHSKQSHISVSSICIIYLCRVLRFGQRRLRPIPSQGIQVLKGKLVSVAAGLYRCGGNATVCVSLRRSWLLHLLIVTMYCRSVAIAVLMMYGVWFLLPVAPSRRVRQVSQELKFLTGDETPSMMRAHVQAGLVVGEPFVDRYSTTPSLEGG